MFKKIGIGVVVLLAGLFGFAATKPDTFRVERTVSINAPAEEIHAHISDFHGWNAWSPYENLDPAMKRTFSGAASGQGAVYEWNGNGKAGAGRMEITEATPSRVTIQLDFTRPFESHNIAEFTLDPQGESTNVTWAMHGPNHYLGKVMGVFFNMDKMVGEDFEAGLVNLKAIVEK
jgi:hypothetical protein